MPKKACCCNQQPPGLRSCCRPIYQGCVGNQYIFTFEFSVNLPCYKYTPGQGLADAEYTCQSNPALSYPITGNLEKFLLTVYYTIEEPAALWDVSPQNQWPNVDFNLDKIFNFGCFGSGFNPNDFNTYRVPYVLDPTNPFGGVQECPDCECQKNTTYSYCNFDESKLRPDCDLNGVGNTPWIYKCGPNGAPQSSVTPPPNFCTNPFGNQLPVIIITEGTYPRYLWDTCYKAYHLQKITKDFTSTDPYPTSSCYQGCTFTPPDKNIKNIPDSFAFQFIPNPEYPEQMDENYIPSLQPDLEYFIYNCRGKDQFIADPYRPIDSETNTDLTSYRIQFNITIGYEKTFNCSENSENPVFETVSIPFLYYEDFFGFDPGYQGISVRGTFDRNTLDNDPMDMCVPLSSSNFPRTTCYSNNPCIDTSVTYKDDYTICAAVDGYVSAGLSDAIPLDPSTQIVYSDYCPAGVPLPGPAFNPCRHQELPPNITVELL